MADVQMRVAKSSYKYAPRKKKFNKFKVKSIPRPMKGTNYDGIYYARVAITRPVLFAATGGEGGASGDMVISWGNNGTTDNNNTYITACAEFTTLRAVFSQWQVNGMKIKYQPLAQPFLVPTNTPTGAVSYRIYGVNHIHSASQPDEQINYATFTDTNMNGCTDYKAYNSNVQEIKRFYNLRKFYETRSQKWLNTNTYYPDASTIFRVNAQGYQNTERVGSITINWYVAFKGIETGA